MGRITAIDGLPVIDAKSAIIVNVTESDVAGASNKDPGDCVFARACRRDAHVREVRVHLSRVYIRLNKGNWLRLTTPPYLRQEIIAFDRGGSFARGEYTLSAPQPSLRLGKRRGGKDKPNRTRALRRLGKKRTAPRIVQDVRATITSHPTDGM